MLRRFPSRSRSDGFLSFWRGLDFNVHDQGEKLKEDG